MRIGVGFRRELAVWAQGKAVWCDFDGLCGKEHGSADFLALAAQCEKLWLHRLPCFSERRRDEARRLVVLIDALYEARVQVTTTSLPSSLPAYLHLSVRPSILTIHFPKPSRIPFMHIFFPSSLCPFPSAPPPPPNLPLRHSESAFLWQIFLSASTAPSRLFEPLLVPLRPHSSEAGPFRADGELTPYFTAKDESWMLQRTLSRLAEMCHEHSCE